MTLTEEQRGTVGFDLEKARAADEALPYPLDANEIWVSGKGQMHINPPNAPSIFFTLSDLCEFRSLFHGQAAEIERLRPFEIAARDLDSDLTKIAGERDDQAARIKDLEDALVEQEARFQYYVQNENCESWPEARQRYPELNEKYIGIARQRLRAEGKIGPDADAKPREGLYGKYRIAKVDGSPVDPNADYFVLRLDSDPVARRAALQYSYMTPDRTLAIGLQEKLTKYNPKMEDCINLQFFGMEKPRIWRITEERVGLLEYCLESLLDAPDIEESTGPRHSIELIRAMLKEVE